MSAVNTPDSTPAPPPQAAQEAAPLAAPDISHGTSRHPADIPAAAWRDCLALTKPRVNLMVLLTAGVGFYLGAAANKDWTWWLLLWAMTGTAMLAASSAVLNQYMEREHDARMPRTKNRPLPSGRASPAEALVLGIALALVGANVLLAFVNDITAILGVITWGSYLFIYTPLKRRSPINTLVGAVPGGLPPVMGYAAATGTIDATALLLLGVMFFWQLPHFQAIAMLYRRDYMAGGYQMLPCVESGPFPRTARSVLLHTLGLLACSIGLALTGVLWIWFAIPAVLLGLWFALKAWKFATAARQEPAPTQTNSDQTLPMSDHLRKTAKGTFLASIGYLPLLLIAMVLLRR